MSARLQATVSENCLEQVKYLEGETGASTSQIVEEALSLYATAFNETLAGRRMGFVQGNVIREFMTTLLAQLEWKGHRGGLTPGGDQGRRPLNAFPPERRSKSATEARQFVEARTNALSPAKKRKQTRLFHADLQRAVESGRLQK